MTDNYGEQGSAYRQDEQKAAEEAYDVQDQIKKLRAELNALAGTVKAIGAAKAASYGAKIADAASEAIDASSTAFEGVKSDFHSLEEAAAERIRAKPLQAMWIALGVGYIIAAMRRH
jgi:ElaB/YqjD/DUF883 family membrane-anchored ribosome-binding protein